jgi:hypothetical protein
MDHQAYKEVYFHEYCKSCRHIKVANTEMPCDECLTEPINLNTHRPVKYEANGTLERRRRNE